VTPGGGTIHHQKPAKPRSVAFRALVAQQICAYVPGTPQRLLLMPDRIISSMPSRIPLVWAGAGIVGALAAGTVLLWSHYGSAVFFEMITAGLAFCF
jgi:hypothetical protein